MSKKILAIGNLCLQKKDVERLKSMGELLNYDEIDSKEDWVERSKEADIICSSIFDTDIACTLKNKFISLPYVNPGRIDVPKLTSSQA